MFFIATLLCAFLAEAGVPNTDQTGDLTILSYNDLYNNLNGETVASILLNTAQNFSSARSTCQLLGETVFTPTVDDLSAGLKNSLSYLIYEESYQPNQLFWGSQESGNSGLCQAINYQGKVSAVSCAEILPALCTQSAPVSNNTFADISPRFQLIHRVGGQALTGYRDFYSFRYLGVRFAPEPERFGYSTVFNGQGSFPALNSSAECYQVPGTGSEDCLFLDVWTPFLAADGASLAKELLKPVLFLIFGGGFTTGSNANPASDGANLASRGDVVVVAINYRLGNLGFLTLEDGVHNGNYGIGDMVTALEWVSRNIAAFGGDPGRVTIAGESSGASAVRALMASPKAKGLFSAAIMQSDPAGIPILGAYADYQTIEDSYELFTATVLTDTGCLNVTDQVACLRALDPLALVSTATEALYPVVDGTYLVNSGLPLNGSYNPGSSVPLLAGTNRDELAIDVPYPPDPNVTVALEVLSELAAFDFLPAFNTGAFPVPTGPNTTLDITNLTSRILTDAGMRCLDEATAYSGSRHGIFPAVYSYVFNRTYQPPTFTRPFCQPPVTAEFPNGDLNAEYFKCHAGEVIYTTGNVLRGLPDRDGLDTPFSQLIVDYWTSFVRTHDPNPSLGYLQARGYHHTVDSIAAAGPWEPVNPQDPTLRWLQVQGTQVPFYELTQCKALGYPLGYYETL